MWMSKPYIEIYQFPQEWSCMNSAYMRNENADYFEKEDDNFVIPYHLFEVM